MKFWTFKVAFICLLLFGAVGSLHAQSLHSKRPPQGSTLGTNTTIPAWILHEVLTQAAPHFNFSPSQFIGMYYTCGCISVVQVGPTTYRVTYGGIGIQIVIDATRKTKDAVGISSICALN